MRTVNGTDYHDDTSDEVIAQLEYSRLYGMRLRIFYGDRETGKSWMDEWEMIGRVGRSTGTSKIPLMIPRRDSSGGGSILDHCIIRIQHAASGAVLYSHPNFHIGSVEIKDAPQTAIDAGLPVGVYIDGGNTANFKSEDRAQKWVDFMLGKRMRSY